MGHVDDLWVTWYGDTANREADELEELERSLRGTWQLVQVVGALAREVVYA